MSRVTYRAPSIDPRGRIAEILDEAHRELRADDLADLLLRVERAIDPSAPVGAEGVEEIARPGSRPVIEYLWALDGALATAAPTAPSSAEAAARAGVDGWLRAYLDDIAARPRGAAVPCA